MLKFNNVRVRIGPNEIVSIDELVMEEGSRLGLVGESGSGKTMAAMSIVGLQPRQAQLSGSLVFKGQELIGLSDRRMARIRGSEIGVIFQDPLRALNPTMRIGRQIFEAVRLNLDVSRHAAWGRALEVMEQVQLPAASTFLRRYPHQLSGGQRQRVLIAMAIASRPSLLIADEPTTALDVSVQEGILDLLVRLSDEEGMGLLFVSHDLGVVQAVSKEVAVIYGGQVVEVGPSDSLIRSPRHRYTEALIGANPGLPPSSLLASAMGRKLDTIPGSVPAVGQYPTGCRFRSRCQHRLDLCGSLPDVTELEDGSRFRCWNPGQGSGGPFELGY